MPLAGEGRGEKKREKVKDGSYAAFGIVSIASIMMLERVL